MILTHLYFIKFSHGWEHVTRREYRYYIQRGYSGKIETY